MINRLISFELNIAYQKIIFKYFFEKEQKNITDITDIFQTARNYQNF